jgi:hypothetical protein
MSGFFAWLRKLLSPTPPVTPVPAPVEARPSPPLPIQPAFTDCFELQQVVIPCGNSTTEIDRIFICSRGLFVVEEKDYKGWIFGQADDERWTQRLTSGSYTFQNPLRQNYKHTKALQELTGLRRDQLLSVIAFSSRAEFKTEMPSNVIRRSRLWAYISSFEEGRLTSDEIRQVRDTIEANRRELSEHVTSLREHWQPRSTDEIPDCPRCNEPMALRTAKKGRHKGEQFWGCTHYPHCGALVQVKV